MQKSPQYADTVPSTSKDPTTSMSIVTPLKFNSKVDELLRTLKLKKATKTENKVGQMYQDFHDVFQMYVSKKC